MRIKSDPQELLELGPSSLRITQAYYQKYESIDEMLRGNPGILDAFHRDASETLKKGSDRRRRSCFTSDHFLRAIVVMEIEQLTYRGTVIRIDDSVFLRRFIGIPFGSIMDFTLLCKVFKSIRPATWKKINARLSQYAAEQEWIHGVSLRVDTTAFETNIHYPTDSSLLWDGYRVMGRLINEIRAYAPEAVGGCRLQTRLVKRTAHLIARRANHKSRRRAMLRKPYKLLLEHVSWIVAWSEEIQEACRARIERGRYGLDTVMFLEVLLSDLEHFAALTSRVIDQTQRRVFEGETVPAEEKLLSLFEPHTELLVRGKSGRPVEFGHMFLHPCSVKTPDLVEKAVVGIDKGPLPLLSCG